MSYQAFVSLCRRYDRDKALILLSNLSRSWDGASHDDNGGLKPFLPWNIANVAAVMICRGTSGGKVPTPDDVALLCNRFLHLQQLGMLDGPEALLRGISRYVYQQVPFQLAGLEQWARPIALYADTQPAPGHAMRTLQEGWAVDLLGCTIAEFVSIGFCVWAGALSGSRPPFDWDQGMEEVLALPGGKATFDHVVEAHYLTDIASFKNERIAAIERGGGTPGEQFGREPFAYNPLVARPYVSGIIPDEWIAPCIPLLEICATELGILYAGLNKWDTAFTVDAGHLFEQYVGRQLKLINDAIVLPEIKYRDSGNTKYTIDWFVILPDVVLLIECKNSVPTAPVREGLTGFGQAHERLNKAISQLNTTARLLGESRPELRSIPTDRPGVGIAVTLGNWEFANEPTVRAAMTQADIPTTIMGVEMLERLVTLDPVGLRLLAPRAIELTQPANVLSARGWLDGLEFRTNPILEAAFDALPAINHFAPGGVVALGAASLESGKEV